MKTVKKLELTRGEEEVMQVVWSLGECSVSEVVEQMAEPRPKYTTVATFLKILENKEFVGRESGGKIHRYFPTVTREEYARGVMSGVMGSYFGGSLAQLVSFFSQHEKISESEKEGILNIIRNTK